MAEPQGEPAKYLARISEWADCHLTLIRNISTGMAIAGVILFAKSIKLTTKFTSALDIPVEFIEKNVKLRGRLCHITEKGLEVEHVPISLPFLSSLQRKWQSNGVLLVRLAGVELTPNAMVWLQEELKPAQMMWFQLLGREDLVLDCLILVNKGRFFSVCLNEEILRQGLGKTTRIEGLHHDSPLYWKLHKRLLQAELKALKKNKGIWKEESYFEKLRDHISNNKFVQKLKQFANWLRIHI
ncbi:protein C3orf33 homolog isoform X1 [Trachemys scripta elegans]|uniref:protein C3orf33 homolog isoform X1 n=1 Tax=Trachemys scripta elegans TaxID=31138 RepID=UPI001554C17F|nr:protein C3orf33 homolog isoform X1 [Trachemys scripta elegans]